MSNKLCLITLGCDKNRVDAEIMANSLAEAGYILTDDPSASDAVLINTCAFIDSAKEEAIEAILGMAEVKADPDSALRAIVVTGCLAERYREQVMKEMPEVDAVVSLFGNDTIAEVVSGVLEGQKTCVTGPAEALPISGKRLLSTPDHYAYLKIAEGCDNHCTYCAIPGIRGKYRSRPIEEIVEEARALAEGGVKELIVVAQDTTSYGKDFGSKQIHELLNRLCEIESLWKIRLLYAYPDGLNDALIDVIASQHKIAKYLDLPLQHANGRVLKRMGRFGSRPELEELIQKLRNRIPGITLRSTFLVGFPGETEEEFEELMDFAKTVEFDRAGCFAYSCEEGTPAARLPDQLDEAVRAARASRFLEQQQRIFEKSLAHMIGKNVEAICDGFDGEIGMFCLRSESDTPDVDTCIYALGEYLPNAGEVVFVKITAVQAGELYGTILGNCCTESSE